MFQKKRREGRGKYHFLSRLWNSSNFKRSYSAVRIATHSEGTKGFKEANIFTFIKRGILWCIKVGMTVGGAQKVQKYNVIEFCLSFSNIFLSFRIVWLFWIFMNSWLFNFAFDFLCQLIQLSLNQHVWTLLVLKFFFKQI